MANSGVHLSPLGIPCTIGKIGLDNLLSLFEVFCRFSSVFRYVGEELLHGHKVPFVAALLTHVVIFPFGTFPSGNLDDLLH